MTKSAIPNPPENTVPATAAAAAPGVIDSSGAQRWALIGAGINTLLAAVKIVAGIVGHSYALVADGVESGLDVAGSLIIWGALKYASRSPDADHPYGHGKAEPLGALIVSGALCGVAVLLAVLSVREIYSPHRAPPAWGALGVLIVVIFVKEFLFRRVSVVGAELSSTAMHADAWHHRSDAITSVAAFVGILIARLGGHGWESADAWAALFACAVIGFNGVRLVAPALAEIMDAAPPPEIESRVRAAASAVGGVSELEKCRVRKMGLNYYVDLHVGVDGLITVARGHEIAHDVKDAVQAADRRIADVLVHIEPANVCVYPPRGRKDEG